MFVRVHAPNKLCRFKIIVQVDPNLTGSKTQTRSFYLTLHYSFWQCSLVNPRFVIVCTFLLGVRRVVTLISEMVSCIFVSIATRYSTLSLECVR